MLHIYISNIYYSTALQYCGAGMWFTAFKNISFGLSRKLDHLKPQRMLSKLLSMDK